MIIEEMAQGSDEWFAFKLGKPSSSRFSDIITSEGNASKSLEKYAYGLVDDIYEYSKPKFKSWEMDRGHESEVKARIKYEDENMLIMRQVGCIQHDDMFAIASPDGLIGGDGMWECKSRLLHIMKTAIKYIKENGRVPTDNYSQCQGQLWIAERAWVDYTIYHPKGIYTFRQFRDDEFIKKMEVLVKKVCDIVKTEVEESIYQQRFGLK